MSEFEDAPTLEMRCRAALSTRGPGYEAAENDLMICGPGCLEVLTAEAAKFQDPLARIYPQIVAPWLPAERHEYRSALAYMTGMAEGTEENVGGVPRPGSLATDIAHLYGRDLAGILLMRAARLEHEPPWRVLTALIYARLNPAPGIMPMLARLATVLADDKPREMALAMFDAWPATDCAATWREESFYWRGVAEMNFFPPTPPPGWRPPDDIPPSSIPKFDEG